MWLLKTESLRLQYFTNPPRSGYAILSHCWEKEEISFQQVQNLDNITHLRGYRKIWNACKTAKNLYKHHIWIDTCCIDKSSSSELSEAINSMYRWYGEASVCLVYLFDVDAVPNASGSAAAGRLDQSKWFTRGWTLQELIAPSDLVFYDLAWTYLGSRDDLMHELVRITKIDQEVLTHRQELQKLSIAKRLSWTARRRTTRIEDEAYALLGIFDVNMPLLYGEGRKAFQRLQEEIIKSSPDQSIFAWHSDTLESLLT